jgi:hypothetical protein
MKSLKNLLLQLEMIKRVLSWIFESQWTVLINSIPAFKQAADSLQTMADNIDTKIANYRQVIKGVAVQKRAARKKLAESSYAIMSSVRSWALKNSNFELAAAMQVTLAELMHMRYITIIQKTGGAISTVEPLVPQLATYNVTPANFTLWQEDHSAMNSLLNGPKSAIQQRKALGTIIATDVKSALDFLNNQLTPLVANFLTTPLFYITFFNNKRIGKGNVLHTRLLANVVNELLVPYYGLTVTVDEYTDPQTGKIYKAEKAITDPQGNCEVSAFFPGFRTVTISGPNIITTTFPALEFKSGKPTIFQFVVQPAFNNIPASQENQNVNA